MPKHCLRIFLLVWAFAAVIAAPVRAESSHPVRILTFNVGLLRDGLYGVFMEMVKEVPYRAELAPEKIARFAEQNKVDIVSLQEVWETAHANEIGRALEAIGYTVVRPNASIWTEIGFYRSGLLVAIRDETFQIRRHKFHLFPSYNLWKTIGLGSEEHGRSGVEVLAKKGFATLVLEHRRTGAYIVLGATHMQALDVTPEGVPTTEAYAKSHAVQSEFMNEIVDTETSGYWMPFVLAGDLNVGRKIGASLYRRILEHKVTANTRSVSAADLLPAGQVTWDPNNKLVKAGAFPTDPPDTIDHVIFRNGRLRWKWVPKAAKVVFKETYKNGTPLSDHNGLLVDAEFVDTLK